MILFEAPVARDLHDALRLLQGRLQGTARRLDPGTVEVIRALERSLALAGAQVPAVGSAALDDAIVPDLLTIPEVSQRMHRGESTVRRMISDGELPSVLIGRSRRVRPDDLEAFIASLPTTGAA